MPSWIVAVDQTTRYLYYIGWTTRVTVPFHNSVGLAISRDSGKTFTKLGEGPLFGPTLTEPYFTGTSCVLSGSGLWRNWYLSCTHWTEYAGRMEPLYHLKYASRPTVFTGSAVDWWLSHCAQDEAGLGQGLGSARKRPLPDVVRTP